MRTNLSLRPQTRRRSGGVASIEFALILPVLLLLVFGVISFGLLMHDMSVATNAVREGARWQAVPTNYLKSGNARGYSIAEKACGRSRVSNPVRPEDVVCNYLLEVPLFGTADGTAPAVSVSGDPEMVTVSLKHGFPWIGYLPLPDNRTLLTRATMYYD